MVSCSENLRAVSFTTAKASGLISFRTASKCLSLSLIRPSMSLNISSFTLRSFSIAAFSCKESISPLMPLRWVLILSLNSNVLLRRSSLDIDLYCSKCPLISNTIGSYSLTSLSYLVPNTFLSKLNMDYSKFILS